MTEPQALPSGSGAPGAAFGTPETPELGHSIFADNRRATRSQTGEKAKRLPQQQVLEVTVTSEDDNQDAEQGAHKRPKKQENGASGAEGNELAPARKIKNPKKDPSAGHSRHKTGTYCPNYSSTEMKLGETARWTAMQTWLVHVREYIEQDVLQPPTGYITKDMFSNGVIIGWRLDGQNTSGETIQFCVLLSPSGFGCISPRFLDIVRRGGPSPNSEAPARVEGFLQGVTEDFLREAQDRGELAWISMCSDAMLSVDFTMLDLFWRMMGFDNAMNMTFLPPLLPEREKARWVNVGTAVTPSLPKQVQDPNLRSQLVPAQYTGSSEALTTTEYAVQIQTCSGSRLGEAVFLGACVPHTGCTEALLRWAMRDPLMGVPVLIDYIQGIQKATYPLIGHLREKEIFVSPYSLLEFLVKGKLQGAENYLSMPYQAGEGFLGLPQDMDLKEFLQQMALQPNSCIPAMGALCLFTAVCQVSCPDVKGAILRHVDSTANTEDGGQGDLGPITGPLVEVSLASMSDDERRKVATWMTGDKMTDVPNDARPAFQAKVMKEMREAQNVPSPGALPWAKTSFSQKYQHRSLAAFFCNNPQEAAKALLVLAGSLKPGTEFFLGTYHTTKKKWLRERGGLVDAVREFLLREEEFIPKGSSLSLHQIPHGKFKLDGQHKTPDKHKREQPQLQTDYTWWRAPPEHAKGAGSSQAATKEDPVDPLLFWDACSSLERGTSGSTTSCENWSRVHAQADSAGHQDFYVKSPAVSQWADNTTRDSNEDQPFADHFVGLLHAFGSSWGVVHMSHCAVVILAAFLLRHENFRQYQEVLNAPSAVTVANMPHHSVEQGETEWQQMIGRRPGRGYKDQPAVVQGKQVVRPDAAGVVQQPKSLSLTDMVNMSREEIKTLIFALETVQARQDEQLKQP